LVHANSAAQSTPPCVCQPRGRNNVVAAIGASKPVASMIIARSTWMAPGGKPRPADAPVCASRTAGAVTEALGAGGGCAHAQTVVRTADAAAVTMRFRASPSTKPHPFRAGNCGR
jgi:hypothetical protein